MGIYKRDSVGCTWEWCIIIRGHENVWNAPSHHWVSWCGVAATSSCSLASPFSSAKQQFGCQLCGCRALFNDLCWQRGHQNTYTADRVLTSMGKCKQHSKNKEKKTLWQLLITSACTPVVRRWSLLTAIWECWLFFDGHRRMSDFTGTSQRDGGNWLSLGEEKGEKPCRVLHNLHCL